MEFAEHQETGASNTHPQQNLTDPVPSQAGSASSQVESSNSSEQIVGVPSTEGSSIDVQNQEQIDIAGIDPNYPLVLVRRLEGNEGDVVEAQALGDNPEENNLNEIDDEVIDNDNEEEEENSDIAEFWSDGIDDDDDMNMESNEHDVAALDTSNLREYARQVDVIRNMINQTRRSMADAEANFGPSDMMPRNSLMQRLRRILFILNNRRRRLIRLGLATSDEENPEEEANAEMEVVGEISDSDELENLQNVTDEAVESQEHEIEEVNENAVRFDTNLPGEHSYMGANMNRVSGVNYLDVGQYSKLRLFKHQHVLFPGEVLPFMVDSSTTIIEGEDEAHEDGLLFGLCFPSLTHDKRDDPNLYGVTCQIYELGSDERGNTLIKSRALQRFVTKINALTVPLEYINSNPRMKCSGFIQVLPDCFLPEPLSCLNMGSLNRFRDNPSMQDSFRRYQTATTPWPVHVYDYYSVSSIIDKARTQLAQHKISTMPTDPIRLSYWLVRNLHLPENMMKSIFLANSVNTRLKLIATTFKEESIFVCRNCSSHIADCRELFAMSKHGVQSQYCNSAGYIHETNTVYQVNKQNILHSGSPSAKFSWFPGYQWHIIVCKICKHHLGWEFKAIEELTPKHFFGISSSSVMVRSAKERNNVPVHNALYMNFISLVNANIE